MRERKMFFLPALRLAAVAIALSAAALALPLPVFAVLDRAAGHSIAGNAGQFLRRNAAASILYADGQPGGCFVQQHFHFAIRRGGFAGILDQVVQHIAQQFRLGQHHGVTAG